MLVKCEVKSSRVKGLSFHPKLSWVLSSLHNGVIQLWDYRIGSMIDKYEEHEGGPIRGVCFHLTQPLFVSGGDDYKIKVWNYKLRRCIFTLLGHLDYIRTVEFHDEQPWIISASDDQTIRIWDWRARSCIAVLTGHNHYVMCAHFHPKEDLVVSASLDQTVRMWDTSSIKNKAETEDDGRAVSLDETQHPDDKNAKKAGVFGPKDAVVKYVMEGHDRGVNWACFHPTLPLIASGADDRLIKMWRWNDSKAWEVDTLHDHFNNVSCVTFLPRKELIVSNSEDRTIRVWDTTKRTCIQTFRRENDRFWVIGAHRTSNLIAVGHDSGMVVFKLDTERPMTSCLGSQLYVVQDREVQQVDLDKSLKGTQKASCRRALNAMTSGIKSMQFNPYNSTEANILVYYSQEGGCYDLFVGANNACNMSPLQGSGNAVAFVARNRFAVLQQSGSVCIYNMQNELSKKLEPPPLASADNVFPGGSNRLIIKAEEKLVLYDLTKKTVGEVLVPGGCRYVSWSPNGHFCALQSKHDVLLVDKNFVLLTSFHENIRIKGGAWDENGVFIYSTLSHVKYCLTNGDSGIIHSISNPIYITRVHRQQLYYIDREQQVNKQKLNCTEFLFKFALHQRKFDDVKMWIANGKLCGSVVIGYLKQKGHPEVALHFVEDQQTRFNLALEYGHIEEAMVAAQELDDRACWNRLGLEALRQGNQQIAERVYQKVGDFDALSFLYFCTGDMKKLEKMLMIAVKRKETMSRFCNAIMLGNVEERVKVMAEAGQAPLAAITAKVHNLTEYIPKLEEQLQGNNVYAHIPAKPSLLIPLKPLALPAAGDAGNWPLIMSTKKVFEKSSFENIQVKEEVNYLDAEEEPQEPEDTGMMGGAWDVDQDLALDGGAAAGAGWGGDMDLDLGLGDFQVEDVPAVDERAATSVTMADSLQTKWLRERKLPADLVAAGEFEEALNLLRRRLGVINAEPFEPMFKRAYWATCSSLPSMPQAPAMNSPLLSEGSGKGKGQKPLTVFNVETVLGMIKDGHRKTTEGKFPEALVCFRNALQSIPLGVANDAKEETQYMDFISMCREYTNAMRIEVTRKGETQASRVLELAAYMTCQKMQAGHVMLTLRVAMSVAFKSQNFILASYFARRLIQSGGQPDVIAQARKLLQVCEQKASDAHAIRFDTKAPVEDFKLCAGSLTPLAPTDQTVQCPFCQASYRSSYKGKLCDTCQLSEIGANTLGIQLRPL